MEAGGENRKPTFYLEFCNSLREQMTGHTKVSTKQASETGAGGGLARKLSLAQLKRVSKE